MTVMDARAADRAFGQALGGRGFGAAGAGAPKPLARPAPPQLRPDDVHIGEADIGGPIGVDLEKLIEGRLLIQGASGAGKSWTLRRLLEQTHGRIQQIIIDPEGEFRSLAEKLDLLHLDGHKLDIATVAIAATRAREHRVSVLVDVSELDRDEQMKVATAFLNALVAVPREHWHPCLVVVDEAHLFAPRGGYTESTSVKKASVASLTDIMSRGRKRGLLSVIATQRLARIATSVTSEALNVMIGLNVLDIDIRRAADTIGWEARKGFDRLPMLAPGEFVTVGPAFSRSPAVVKVGAVETKHMGATPALRPPTALTTRAAATALDLETLMAESAADREQLEDRAEPGKLRHVRNFIREAAFPDAGRVYGALVKVAPDGGNVADLAKHLNRKEQDVAAALALLDQFGVIEFTGDGPKRAVRIAKGMLP